jgi:hypothetical protein
MSSTEEINETARTWRIRFEIELLKRGGTESARQEMIDETPDWLRNILGIPLKFGNHPIDCTCAQWYMDGTHAKACNHQVKHSEGKTS